MRTRPGIGVAAGALWATACAVGFAALADYSFKTVPVPEGAAAAQWPAGTGLEIAAGQPTLVMAAHPQCPCTRASIEELALIQAAVGERLAMHVLFVELEGVPARQALWEQAAAIPGIEVHADPDGRAARALGAAASGHVFVYGPSGDLLYSGGVTGARGHVGDNFGRDAILAIVRGEPPPPHTPPAFGCALASHRPEAGP